MRSFHLTTQFRRDLKKALKQGKPEPLVRTIMEALIRGESLPVKFKDHTLRGNYAGSRECHLQPDWLMIYRVNENTIIFERLGSHSDLF